MGGVIVWGEPLSTFSFSMSVEDGEVDIGLCDFESFWVVEDIIKWLGNDDAKEWNER